MNRYLMGLDVGTTSFKGALFDQNRRLVAAGQRDYTLGTPGPDRVEFAPEEYWRVLCDLIGELLVKSRVPEDEVTALALSSQGETLICLDAQGAPLGNAIVWLDNRAVEEADELKARFGRALIYNKTGQADMTATWPAAKILWLKRKRPDIFERTDKFLLLEDYLLYRLTGGFEGEKNLWASSAMMDVHTGLWWEDMLAELGVPSSKLPRIRDCGRPVGHITSDAARQTGLSKKVLAVTGALDQTCNAIGCGITRPGTICETTGSCLAVSAVLDKFVPYNPQMRITCQNHATPGRYTVLLWSQSAGMVLKWFAKKFYSEYPDLEDAFARMNADAATVAAGCNGMTMLPHLSGASNPEYDPSARGVFFGAAIEHGREHFTRAIMEAVAYMLRRNLEQLDALGVTYDAVYCMGGGVNSPLWLKIKADATGKAMIPLRAQGSACLGAAILAGQGAGLYAGIDWVPEEPAEAVPIPADRTQRAAYDEAYRRYIDLYNALHPLFLKNAASARAL